VVCVLAPLATFGLDVWIKSSLGWSLGFEVLAVNATLSALGLWSISYRVSKEPADMSQSN